MYRMGEPKVPTVEEFLREKLPDKGVIGVDGRTIGVNTGCIYEEIAKEKGGVLLYDIDIASSVWKEQPALSQKSVFPLPLKYTGKSTAQKLEQIKRKVMKENKTDVHVLTSLDDIGWILNLRGTGCRILPFVFVLYDYQTGYSRALCG